MMNKPPCYKIYIEGFENIKIPVYFYIYPILGNKYYSPTGEAYITLTSGGIKKEGEYPVFFFSDNSAVLAYKEEFKKYCKGKEGILYFRTKPEIEQNKYGYSVYSRLLISNREPLY